MGTRDENLANPDSCWNKAEPNEQLFVMRGHDRHAPALIRLWAAMREKEGESPVVVADARGIAQLMEDEAVALGRVYLSMEAVASFATTFKAEQAADAGNGIATPMTQPGAPYTLTVGQVVVAGRGRPAKLVRIFADNDPNENVRGMANIQVPGHGPVTVSYQALRPALPEEIEQFRNTGGRL